MSSNTFKESDARIAALMGTMSAKEVKAAQECHRVDHGKNIATQMTIAADAIEEVGYAVACLCDVNQPQDVKSIRDHFAGITGAAISAVEKAFSKQVADEQGAIQRSIIESVAMDACDGPVTPFVILCRALELARSTSIDTTDIADFVAGELPATDWEVSILDSSEGC